MEKNISDYAKELKVYIDQKKIHNVKFNFTGNEDFLNGLMNHLEENVGIKSVKLNKWHANHRKNVSGNVAMLEYSGMNNIEKMYNYMYNDSNYYFGVKKRKFIEILSYRK